MIFFNHSLYVYMCQLKLSRPLTVCKYETKKKEKQLS